jgi:hypothetical protein
VLERELKYNIDMKESISRQRVAVLSLLFQALVILGFIVWAFYIFSTSEPSDMVLGIIGFFIFPVPLALLPLLLATELYRGRVHRKCLQGWAGTCISFGLFYLLVMIRSLPDFDIYRVTTIATVLFLLLPSGLVLRFTGLSTWKWSSSSKPAPNPFENGE